MNLRKTPKFVVLAILDGWGIAQEGPGNAITQAKTVNMKKLWASYPHTSLQASGEAVGLPKGEDGNTETGHLNIGAGRIVYQDLERIHMSIADGSFFSNDVLLKAIEHANENDSNLHIMGLIGAGGAHSSMDHLFALIHFARLKKLKNNLYLHLFTDGRDSPPTAAKTYLDNVKKVIAKEKVGKIVTIMGRYWAMDRDSHWERTEKAYVALTEGEGNYFSSAEEAVEASYENGVTDEFIEPSIIAENKKDVEGLINDNDSVIFFNFRIDRPRQLTKAFLFESIESAMAAKDFDPYEAKYKMSGSVEEKRKPAKFEKERHLKNLFFVTMTEYSKIISEKGGIPAFPPERIDMPLGRVVSMQGNRQLRITESEKERFVTFYFNGLREQPFPLEERIIIPSPDVPTYDQKPEMSAEKITLTLLQKLETQDYALAVVNFPNADMVGHTGNIGPAVKAVETVDHAIGKLSNFVLAYEGVLIITADHGNAEEMINSQTGEIDTEHSTNPVPFIAVSQSLLGKSQTLTSGILADVSPTILSLLDIPIPGTMTGKNLLQGII